MDLLFIMTLGLVYLWVAASKDAVPTVNKEDLLKSDLASLPQEMVKKQLVDEKIDILDILDYHNSTFGDASSPKRIKHMVLGYVTPWNNKGYDRAVKYASKFTHISPVWLQVVPDMIKGRYQMQGTHDVDRDWIKRIRTNNANIKIVPRVMLEKFDGRSLQELVFNERYALEMASLIVKTIVQYKMDGAVLEMWKPVADDTARRALRSMVKVVADRLKQDGLQSILVVPPSGGKEVPGRLRNEDFKVLSESVEAFSVMTYDHPDTYTSGGAIAPVDWMIDSLEHLLTSKEKSKRKKLLVGLNHYGYDFNRKTGAEPITGDTFLQHLIEHQPQLRWDAKSAEHVYGYSKDGQEHVVHFPTLKSLHVRINLAKKLGFGLAIWELGQGLDYFFPIL